MDRRAFLRGGAAALGGLAVAGPFQALLARSARGAVLRTGEPARAAPGYGPLSEVVDETTGLPLLKLPEGFRYVSFGWTGDEMSDGEHTPAAHDGMAVVAQPDADHVLLIRNHEVSSPGTPFARPAISYDPRARGGTTSLLFNVREGRLERSWASISGTANNCAGGPTPWGSWLTCEETVSGPEPFGFTRDHGFIFEVPAQGDADPTPLTEMGRFVHEAIAVDPETGVVYETEDRYPAGLYRYIPNEPGRLAAGGRLQMLKVVDRDDITTGMRVGQVLDTEWVDIDDPTLAHSPDTEDEHGVWGQGKRQGAVTLTRLEGCWYAEGFVYFVSTNGGDVGEGQVWQYNPREEQLRLIFESPSAELLDSPDNITVSPRGGIVLCEDGSQDAQRLHGLTRGGDLFPLAANNVVLRGECNAISGDFRPEEWAGCCFSPDGRWLFANLQRPGITVAITGPWEEGPL